MRKPQPPPNLMSLLTEKTKDPDFLTRALAGGYASEADRYMPWDELRWRPAPEGLTHEEWWLVSKIARNGMERALPLSDAEGRRFSYALPDEVLRGIEVVDKHLSGRIGVPRVVTEDARTRDERMILNNYQAMQLAVPDM
jgi:hypothetical protein